MILGMLRRILDWSQRFMNSPTRFVMFFRKSNIPQIGYQGNFPTSDTVEDPFHDNSVILSRIELDLNFIFDLIHQRINPYSNNVLPCLEELLEFVSFRQSFLLIQAQQKVQPLMKRQQKCLLVSLGV